MYLWVGLVISMAAASLPDSSLSMLDRQVSTDSLATLILEDQPDTVGNGERDWYQYRVGFFRKRWRTDYVFRTLVYGRDTLGANLNLENLRRVIMATELPDDAQVELCLTIMRYDQRDDGSVIRSPYPVYDVDENRLMALHRKWRSAAPHRP